MFTAGHSKPWAKGEAAAHHHQQATKRFHYDDRLKPAQGIIAAMLLGIGLWWMARAFFFG
jgi:hypothetical protein